MRKFQRLTFPSSFQPHYDTLGDVSVSRLSGTEFGHQWSSATWVKASHRCLVLHSAILFNCSFTPQAGIGSFPLNVVTRHQRDPCVRTATVCGNPGSSIKLWIFHLLWVTTRTTDSFRTSWSLSSMACLMLSQAFICLS